MKLFFNFIQRELSKKRFTETQIKNLSFTITGFVIIIGGCLFLLPFFYKTPMVNYPTTSIGLVLLVILFLLHSLGKNEGGDKTLSDKYQEMEKVLNRAIKVIYKN